MKKKFIILSLVIAVCLQCNRKESVISQTVIIPDSLNLLRELSIGKKDIYIIPVSYTCSSCIEIIKLCQQLVIDGHISEYQSIVFLARGEPDEYFLHHINNLNFKYFLIQDKFNDFLSLNNLLNLNNGACIILNGEKIKWVGYPFHKKKDLKYLLRKKNEN